MSWISHVKFDKFENVNQLPLLSCNFFFSCNVALQRYLLEDKLPCIPTAIGHVLSIKN